MAPGPKQPTSRSRQPAPLRGDRPSSPRSEDYSVARLGFLAASNQLIKDIRRLGDRVSDEEAPLGPWVVDHLNVTLRELVKAVRGQEFPIYQLKPIHLQTISTAHTVDQLVQRYEADKQFAESFHELKRNFSIFQDELYILRHGKAKATAVPAGLLKEPRVSFENVAKKAAELAEDIKSLDELERARIMEALSDAVGLDVFLQFLAATSVAASSVTLPKKPLEKWPGATRRGRPRKDEDRESAVDFVKRVYGPYFEHGFTREHLRAIDPVLENGLRTFERRNPDHCLNDFRSEPMGTRTRQLIDALSRALPEDELRRIGTTLQSRHYRSSIPSQKPRPK